MVYLSDFLKLVGEKIRIIRKVQGLTQEELAERSNLQDSYIGGIERGERNVSLLTLEKIIKGLNVSPESLFKFENNDVNNYNEKNNIIEIYKSFLSERDEEELKVIHKITKDIVSLIDRKNDKV